MSGKLVDRDSVRPYKHGKRRSSGFDRVMAVVIFILIFLAGSFDLLANLLQGAW
jgi:hypothetical protein